MVLSKRKFKNEHPLNVLFNEFIGNDFANTNIQKPKVNITETDESIKLDLAAPGLTKKDFKIDLDDNLITISTKIEKSESETSKEKFTRKEFDFTSFKRTFTLPKTVEASAIEANYESGILKIKFPKKEEAKKLKRAIEIS